MNHDAELDQQIADEMTGRELARRDAADRSLMDAARAMWYSGTSSNFQPFPGDYGTRWPPRDLQEQMVRDRGISHGQAVKEEADAELEAG